MVLSFQHVTPIVSQQLSSTLSIWVTSIVNN
jgi:hypothetical protein